MENLKKIEKAVCSFYKVEAEAAYKTSRSKYPLGTAKDVLMYMYYANGFKVYDIAKMFGVSERLVFRKCAEINVALKSDTKIKEDIESINKIINNI